MPSLTGRTFAIASVSLAILLPLLATALTARHRQRRRVLGALGQWLTTIVAQAMAVVAVLVLVNNQYGLYASWNDLLGTAPSGSTHASIPSSTPATASTAAWVNGAPEGFSGSLRTRTFRTTVAVKGTKAALQLWVVVPPRYTETANATAKFPVLELLHGYPGSPWTWLHAMNVQQHLAESVAAGGVPYVLVIPSISVPGAPDLECTNLPHQPQIATFITKQVHDIVTSRFRVRTDAKGWAMLGYSEGGYCAAQLVMRNPSMYAAAVSIAGYDYPLSPYFDSLKSYRTAGSFQVLLRSRPAVAILASESAQDPQASGTLDALRKYAKSPTVVSTVLHPTGGHNPGTWQAELSADMLWASKHTGGVQ